ncbi:integrase [Salinisphaera orenii MK-B5]|uniref:Integrase n=1 Tax=Salinisphaera orenii MK-B5 TaxID=856730 RepID=A0A423PXU8_9GAMM|nr:site-specific integrase [Salinisphaera orenii]ROO30411.1 integrase [Salinisphaera orenii MK-B5]
MGHRLTDRVVKALETPDGKYTIVWDDKTPGFAVRVTKTGAKSFILNYRTHGRERRYTIGKYPAWSVAAAREQAAKLRRQIDLGEDPLGERKAAAGELTVGDLIDQYLAEHVAHKNAAGTATNYTYWLNSLVRPDLGKRKITAIKPADLRRIHRDLSKGRPILANRTISTVQRMYNYAIAEDLCSDNPAKGIEKNPEAGRERYLSGDELRRLCKALADYPYMHKVRLSREEALATGSKSAWRRRENPLADRIQSCNAIRLLMLTGARKGELLSAKWADIDLQAGVWIKPGATTKQRTTHRVPLSAPAMELLAGIEPSSEYVFPGSGGQPQKDLKKTWASVCELAEIEGVRIHDLRHTYAAQLVSAGLSLPIIGALLGHTQADTTQRYAHLMDDPLREATERVGSIVSGAEGGERAEVVNIRGRT